MKLLLRLLLESVAGAVVVAVSIGYLWSSAEKTEIVVFYSSNLRSELFGGLLTFAGFTFALKTFLIITLKKELYDHPNYVARYNERVETDSSLKLYGPLDRLRVFLSATVVVSLVSSLAQVTLGFFAIWYMSYVCIALAVISLFLVMGSISHMWSNLADLVEHWEDSLGDRPKNENTSQVQDREVQSEVPKAELDQ